MATIDSIEQKEKRGCEIYALDKEQGVWGDWIFDGNAKVSFGNGDSYDGLWKDGKFHGRGVLIFFEGMQYASRGIGMCTWPDGCCYDAEWVSNNIHGTQTAMILSDTFSTDIQYYSRRRKYDGEWQNGYIHGRGVYTYPDESTYNGEWEMGYKNGRGVYTYADGSKHEGEWKDGRQNGWFVTIFPDGGKCEVFYKNDVAYDDNTFTRINGDIYATKWIMGEISLQYELISDDEIIQQDKIDSLKCLGIM